MRGKTRATPPAGSRSARRRARAAPPREARARRAPRRRARSRPASRRRASRPPALPPRARAAAARAWPRASRCRPRRRADRATAARSRQTHGDAAAAPRGRRRARSRRPRRAGSRRSPRGALRAPRASRRRAIRRDCPQGGLWPARSPWLSRVLLQSPPQQHARAGEARLHGARGAAHELRDLALGEPLEVEQDDRARVLREGREGGLDVLDDAAQALELEVIAQELAISALDDVQLTERLFGPSLSARVDEGVSQDAEQP